MNHSTSTGILVVVAARPDEPPFDVARVVAEAGLTPLRAVAGTWLTSWGHASALPTATRPLLLSGRARRGGASVADDCVARLLRDGDVVEVGRFDPPFAALGLAEDGVRVATDRMGFSQVFWCRGPGWHAVSTSARLLGRLLGGVLDDEGVLVQSQVGWQLGCRTLYRGVTKLAPGESATLDRSGLRISRGADDAVEPGSTPLDDAVTIAATLLRRSMATYLQEVEHPVLQLTGGMDSRAVLSSVPACSRAGLRAFTLDAPGSADATVARSLAELARLDHRVYSLDGLAAVRPDEWFARVRASAEDHDAMVNPVAKAATGWAEASIDQGDRLGGMGGEVARGFFYAGAVRPSAVTRRRSERLARWRLMANDAVEPAALHVRHRLVAPATAVDAVHAALVEAGDEWFSATDDLYYRHRLPRWAGPDQTAASHRRRIMNVMLDPDFMSLVRSVAPREKHRARFWGRLQMELDQELGRLPLEGRPPPEHYARGGRSARTRHVVRQLEKAALKARQRALGARRPPVGGTTVAGAVVHHVRAHGAVLEPLRHSGWFDDGWLDAVLDGTVHPQPSTVAFMVNMLVALDPALDPTRDPTEALP